MKKYVAGLLVVSHDQKFFPHPAERPVPFTAQVVWGNQATTLKFRNEQERGHFAEAIWRKGRFEMGGSPEDWMVCATIDEGFVTRIVRNGGFVQSKRPFWESPSQGISKAA